MRKLNKEHLKEFRQALLTCIYWVLGINAVIFIPYLLSFLFNPFTFEISEAPGMEMPLRWFAGILNISLLAAIAVLLWAIWMIFDWLFPKVDKKRGDE